MTGTVYKRCSCFPVVDGAGRRKNCSKRHGSWFFAHDVHDPSGKRRQIRRGGFDTAADARAALQASLTATGQGVRVQDQHRVTVATYLEGWLARKKATGRFARGRRRPGARVGAPPGGATRAAVAVLGPSDPRHAAVGAE